MIRDIFDNYKNTPKISGSCTSARYETVRKYPLLLFDNMRFNNVSLLYRHYSYIYRILLRDDASNT